MRIVLPRVIIGNRGDLASRWGILRALRELDVEDVIVFRDQPGDAPDLGYPELPYGRLRNLLPGRAGWRALRRAEAVIWSAGLDLQDDSSLIRSAYIGVLFGLYRLLGLKVWALFQGAGPLTTRPGRWFARLALRFTTVFVTRDPGTYRLVGELRPGLRRVLAHDAIFLPGFEDEIRALDPASRAQVDELTGGPGPLIGLNLRQWFHFRSSLLPYQLAQRRYREQSQAQMERVLEAAVELVGQLRAEQDARVLLISAYQPGTLPWEDDLPWLRRVKQRFAGDERVRLVEAPLTLPVYYDMMARLDLMIGMRLHAALIALRMGVPAVNISYTLKGGDILDHLGLGANAIALADFMEDPGRVLARAAAILRDPAAERGRVRAAVDAAIRTNLTALRNLLEE